MQITKAEVTSVELKLRQPVRGIHFLTRPDARPKFSPGSAEAENVTSITSIFVRIETRRGQSAWGCTVAHPTLTGEKPEEVLHACRECAALLPDLHPMNIEYSLDALAAQVKISPAVMCAFDLAFHDLLSLSAGMPLYRILGGFRSRIQTSITIPLAQISESIETARFRASQGFRILKIKGGLDPAEDVKRAHAIHQALPNHILRLDADGGYSVQDALDVARALRSVIEMLEQPTPAGDLTGLRQVKELSPVPILADESLKGPASALELAANRVVDGLSIKLVACGGLRCGRQIDAIARAARLATMVGCFIEPAMLISAGLSLALSSPNVRYGDLDGYLNLLDDPSLPGFSLVDGWLVASDVPGLGYTVALG